MITQTYYLDAASLSSATAIFFDSALSLCATDGFYSDGIIVRELVGCKLLPPQSCPSCGTPCGGTISGSGGAGIYLLNIDAGNSVGAIQIYFDPYSQPDGLVATYDGAVYNKMVSPTYGVLQSSVPSVPTYVGQTAASCSIVTIGGTQTVNEYIYDGTSFILSGNTQNVTVVSGQAALTSTAPGSCVMVIPKTSTSPSTIAMQIIGLCSGTGWSIEVACPQLLTPIPRSTNFPVFEVNESAFCAAAKNLQFYCVTINGLSGTLNQYDLVFQDQYGATPLVDGTYKINVSDSPFAVSNAMVVINGVIDSFASYCKA